MSISMSPPLGALSIKSATSSRTRLNLGSALGSTSIALFALSLATTPAQAADECGAAASGSVTCSPAGNPYDDGISYSGGDDDLTIVLEDGVNINLSSTPFNSNALFVGSQAGSITVLHEGGLIESSNDSFATVSLASHNGGDTTATLSEVRGSGLSGRGIEISSNLGATSLTVNDVQTSGDTGNAIDAFGRTGLTVDIGSARTTGSSSTALNASSDGVITVNAGELVTEGATSKGIYLRGRDDINLTADSVVTSGADSVAVHIQGYTPGTTAILNITNAATAGADSSAIHVTHSGDINLSAETVETAGDNSGAIYLRSSEGFATVNIGSIATQGDAAMGLEVDAHGGAHVTVGQISTLGDNSTGARVNGEEDLTIVSTDGITTQGAHSYGISAESRTGSITITASNITTGGFKASGIEAISYDSFATVTANNVTTAGDNAHGVDVRSMMDAAATVTATNVTTSGEGAFGVVVGTVTGSVSVTATDITTTGVYGVGVAAHSYGDGALSVVANNVSTTGADAFGVVAVAYGQSASSVTANNVSTTGADAYGVMVRTDLSADVAASNIATTGDNAHGVLVAAQDQVNVSITGPVSTTGAGAVAVSLYSQTDITLNATGPITTSGDNAIGIAIEGNNGTTAITVADVATTGTDANGIFAKTYGDVTVKAGNVSAAQAQAILAESTANITIATTGNITSASTNAIEVQADQLATIDIAGGSIVSGATSAIVSRSLYDTTINNAGTLNAGSAATISADGPQITFNNSGTLNGYVEFVANNSVVDNSGIFNAVGTSTFSGADNLFINNGTLTATNASLQGLGRFVNNGLISLHNGTVGNHLTLSGDYYGEGGILAMDIDFGAGTADRLTIDGAATGLTTVRFNAVGTPALLGAPFVFIDAGAGSESDAFVADTIQAGFYGYIVTFDAANNDYLVTPTVGDSTFGTLKFNEAAQSLWYKTADVVSAHLTSRRLGSDQHTGNGRIWGQLHGSYDKRDQTLSYSTALGNQTSDVSYRQDYFGGQLGVDLGATESNFGFGLTTGYVNSKLKLAARSDRATYNAFNFGAYGSYNAGNFFANLLAKYDIYNIKARSVSGEYAESFDGKSYGAQLEAGFRLGSDRFFAEPIASIALVRTDLDELAVSNVVIDFDKLDGLRGKLGVRVGGVRPMAGGSLTWYASGQAVKEFEGRDGVTFIDGLNNVHLKNKRIGTYGQGDLGVSIISANGVAGFLEGGAKFGDDYRGYSGRVGLRLAF